MILEAASHGLERLASALFMVGIGTFLLATSADGAAHLFGRHDLEAPAHLAIFGGMAIASLGLLVRGATAQRKEGAYALR